MSRNISNTAVEGFAYNSENGTLAVSFLSVTAREKEGKSATAILDLKQKPEENLPGVRLFAQALLPNSLGNSKRNESMQLTLTTKAGELSSVITASSGYEDWLPKMIGYYREVGQDGYWANFHSFLETLQRTVNEKAAPVLL